MNRLDPDPLTVPEPDPVPRRSGCALALILGALAWLAILVVFALGFFAGRVG
jgi:hypothetical protein